MLETACVLETMTREVLIRCVARIGVQTVERDGDRYFITIRNRSYASEHEVSLETARRYYRKMSCGDESASRIG